MEGVPLQGPPQDEDPLGPAPRRGTGELLGSAEGIGVPGVQGDGARQDAGRDQGAVAADQQFRGGADHAVDQVIPGHRVGPQEPAQYMTRVDGGFCDGLQGAGQHHLADLVVADACHGFSDDVRPVLTGQAVRD